MKKILLATTMLAGFAGAASAEMALSGSAIMGVGVDEFDSYSIMETYVTFTGTGETDGGLSFGMSSTLATYSTDDAQAGDGFSNDGTSVFISGAFGKLSMGSVDEADKVAGLSDIGLAGLGVDNVAEVDVGAGDHNVNYTYAAGSFSVSASADIDATDYYAVGGKYSFGDYYVGAGYNYANGEGVTSVYAGGTMGAVNVAAMFSSNDNANDLAPVTTNAYGLYGSYTTGALTISAEIADNDYDAEASYGIGASYDLGGGASVVGGAASVKGATAMNVGVSMSF
jgi:outer membrane protein OmpU